MGTYLDPNVSESKLPHSLGVFGFRLFLLADVRAGSDDTKRLAEHEKLRAGEGLDGSICLYATLYHSLEKWIVRPWSLPPCYVNSYQSSLKAVWR